MNLQYTNTHTPYGPYERFFKRPLDFICGLLAIIVFCWLYAIIAILVRIKLGSPVLFKQQRPGKNEKIFTLYKFRTMTDKRDTEGQLLPDDERLTKFGKALRKSSLDEIPCAFNLLNGTMSVVGPRPLLVEYLPYYTEVEHHRHDIRPGITGLAQVKGRNMLGWNERLEYDVKYTHSISFMQDLLILIKTIFKFIIKSDITDDGHYKMQDFNKERLMEIKLLNINMLLQHEKEIENLLRQALFSNFFEDEIPNIFLSEKLKKLKCYLKNKSAIVYVCLQNNKIIGLIWGHEIKRLKETNFHIAYLSVEKSFRRQGIGKNLIMAAQEYAKTKGYDGMELFVSKGNDNAVSMYTNNDWYVERYFLKKPL